jgi:hypothetical protein
MSKEIKINPKLFEVKGTSKKTLKNGKNIKKAILDSLAETSTDVLKDLEVMTDSLPEQSKESTNPVVKPDTTYGCLKNGKKPTLRHTEQQTKKVKQYSSFGKTKNVVNVFIKDKDSYAKLEKDIKKMEKTSMITIKNYLRTRKLYKVGSSAPDDVLREIYLNAQLAGNVENNNPETLVHNYVNDEP